jgi:hypothetical protein
VTTAPAPGVEGEVIAIPLTVSRDEVLHFLGYVGERRPADRIDRLLEVALEDARRLVFARGVFVRHPVDRSREVGLEPVEASGLVLGIVTIGLPLERWAAELMTTGQATRSLLLDAAGSAAVEEAADRLGAIIGGDSAADARSAAAHVSCRVSPGYGGWPIRSQQSLFSVVPHRDAGVTLLPSMMMVPRKSISFAMWLGADRRPVAGLSGCARCELEQCRYRRGAG